MKDVLVLHLTTDMVWISFLSFPKPNPNLRPGGGIVLLDSPYMVSVRHDDESTSPSYTNDHTPEVQAQEDRPLELIY